MTEKPRRNAALPGAAVIVFGLGCAAWMFPRAAASAVGSWMLPVLSMAGLALALGLASEWRGLRGFLAVLATTLVIAWVRAADSATSTQHFAGASFGLLLMLIVGRLVDTPRRLRLAMVTFLSGGLVVLVLGFAGTAFFRLAPSVAVLTTRLPALRLGLVGLEPEGYVNTNALAAAALLIAPLGASVLLFGSREKFDLFGLRPLGLVVLVVGMLVLVVSGSRTAWLAVWLTLVALLVRGLRAWAWRAVAGMAVMALPIVAIIGIRSVSKDQFLLKTSDLWLSVHDRANIMVAGAGQWRESPWFGIGLNQFHHLYRPPTNAFDPDVAHAHNVFLQTALDVGLLGLIAYLGAFGFLLMRADQVARGPSKPCRGAAIGAGLSLVAVSAFGLADAVALGAKIGLFQWMAAGLILGAWRAQGRARTQAT